MTPPDDRNGQYGVPYPGTGHDAFGVPGVGHGHGQHAGFAGHQHGVAQPQQQHQYGAEYFGHNQSAQQHAQQHGYGGGSSSSGYPGPEAFPEHPAMPYQDEEPGYVEEFEEQDSGPLIRPFAMTGGRTRPRYELAIEALVSASVDPVRLASLLPEHQRICTLCTEVKSIAEVSALLSIPLGVARILVADLAEAGLVTIHQPAAGGESGNQPDVTLLERVLSGLRKL